MDANPTLDCSEQKNCYRLFARKRKFGKHETELMHFFLDVCQPYLGRSIYEVGYCDLTIVQTVPKVEYPPSSSSVVWHNVAA